MINEKQVVQLIKNQPIMVTCRQAEPAEYRVSPAAHGTIVRNASPWSMSYYPKQDHVGNDQFQVTASLVSGETVVTTIDLLIVNSDVGADIYPPIIFPEGHASQIAVPVEDPKPRTLDDVLAELKVLFNKR